MEETTDIVKKELKDLNNINNSIKSYLEVTDSTDHLSLCSLSKDNSDKIVQLGMSYYELICHGCQTCVLKEFDVCPHKMSGTDIFGVGICNDYVDFFLRLSPKAVTSQQLWECVDIELMYMQSMEDFKKFRALHTEIEKLKSSGKYDKDTMEELEAKRNTYKMWWSKLAETVTRGRSKVADRVSKDDNVDKVLGVRLSDIHRHVVDIEEVKKE